MKIEELLGIEKLNILQCKEIAKKLDFDKLKFTLHGPSGSLKCTWLDAYMGIFKTENSNGFLMVNDFQFVPNVWCSISLDDIEIDKEE